MATLTLNLIFGAAAGFPGSACGEDVAPSEYQMKAAYLYNFAKFVEWPKTTLPDQAPLVIGVLGEDPFGGLLDSTIRDKTIDGHPVEARRIQSLEEAAACEVLFISSSEKKHWQEISRVLAGSSVLTVSENWDHFTDAGGIIYLFMEDRRVCFDINVEAARRASLKVSSKLILLRKKPPA